MSSVGQGSISVSQKAPAGGAPFPAGSADNGLSVDPITGRIVLGNDEGDPASPAQLLSNREILMNNFLLSMTEGNIGASNFFVGIIKQRVEGSIIMLRATDTAFGTYAISDINDSNGVFVGWTPAP